MIATEAGLKRCFQNSGVTGAKLFNVIPLDSR
jgi:hypothetical protein